jgi:hypothetical protein
MWLKQQCYNLLCIWLFRILYMIQTTLEFPFFIFLSFPAGKSGMVPWIIVRQSPSTSSPMHHLLITTPFNTVHCSCSRCREINLNEIRIMLSNSVGSQKPCVRACSTLLGITKAWTLATLVPHFSGTYKHCKPTLLCYLTTSFHNLIQYILSKSFGTKII